LQLFQAPEKIKEKVKIFKSNQLKPYDENEERIQEFERIDIKGHHEFDSYDSFLEYNLLENVKRNIVVMLEMYPRNIQKYKDYLGNKVEVYKLTPCFKSII